MTQPAEDSPKRLAVFAMIKRARDTAQKQEDGDIRLRNLETNMRFLREHWEKANEQMLSWKHTADSTWDELWRTRGEVERRQDEYDAMTMRKKQRDRCRMGEAMHHRSVGLLQTQAEDVAEREAARIPSLGPLLRRLAELEARLAVFERGAAGKE